MKIRLNPTMSAKKWTPEELLLDSLHNGGRTQESPIIYCFDFTYKMVYAEGITIEGGFVVLKGSRAANIENRKLNSKHKRIRQQLIDSGVLLDKGLHLEFTKPHLFFNEYEATGVIAGNNNYRKHSGIWLDREERTPLENELVGIVELEAKHIEQINN